MRPAEKRLLVFLCLAAAAIAGVTVTLTAFNKPADYAVSLAGLHDGLDEAVATATRLTAQLNTSVVPALFKLAVHIRNPSKVLSSCVTRDATVAVSHNGVEVARGGVPVVCARSGGGGEGEVAGVPVWAVDLDAARRLVPPDGAVVDVAVRMPRAAVGRHGLYRVTVGGELSLCKSSWSLGFHA